jgi:hypothetical protein
MRSIEERPHLELASHDDKAWAMSISFMFRFALLSSPSVVGAET